MRGHGDGGEAQARGRNRLEEEGQELWKLAELAKVVENFGVLGNRVAASCHLHYLNLGDCTTGRFEINGRIGSGQRFHGG